MLARLLHTVLKYYQLLQMWMSAVKVLQPAMLTLAVSTSMVATGVCVILATLHGAECAWVSQTNPHINITLYWVYQ